MNEGTLPPAGQLSPAWVDFFIVLGVILLVTLGLMFWALVFSTKARHRRHRHRHHHHHHHHRENYREKFRKNAADIKELIQPHRHHHRHKHRPTNPTLAETGGLPPIREQEKPPLPPLP